MKRLLWPLIGLGVAYLHLDRIVPHSGIGAEVVTGAVAFVIILQGMLLLRE